MQLTDLYMHLFFYSRMQFFKILNISIFMSSFFDIFAFSFCTPSISELFNLFCRSLFETFLLISFFLAIIIQNILDDFKRFIERSFLLQIIRSLSYSLFIAHASDFILGDSNLKIDSIKFFKEILQHKNNVLLTQYQ